MIQHLRRLPLKTSGVFRTKLFENTVTYVIIKLFTQTSILTSKIAVETLNIFIKQLLDIWLFFCYSVTFHSKHSCDVIDSQVVQHTLLMTHNGNLDWQFFLVLLMNKNNINAETYYTIIAQYFYVETQPPSAFLVSPQKQSCHGTFSISWLKGATHLSCVVLFT